MKTAFGGDDRGCPICQDERPPVETTINADGSQIRQQKCGLCSKVWGFQHLTLEQVIIMDVQAESAQLFGNLADALASPAGSAAYAAVMEEARMVYGPELADHLSGVFGEMARAVRAAHLAAVTEPAYRHPGSAS